MRDSVAAASASERALGVRAALAGRKLEEWYRELEGWPWPADYNGFGPPPAHRQPIEQEEVFGKGSAQILNSQDQQLSGGKYRGQIEYWGSLTSHTVQTYSHRIEIIQDEMEALELDELRVFVRDTYLGPGSRRSSTQSPLNPDHTGTAYTRLDDFTAIVTSTILQLLPIISRLEQMLEFWDTRLRVLQRVPGLLQRQEQAATAVASAWRAIMALPKDSDEEVIILDNDLFLKMRSTLQGKIEDVGEQLDYMLDLLEGKDDVLPDQWIDEMNELESEFGSWVVEAERSVLMRQLKTEEIGIIRVESLESFTRASLAQTNLQTATPFLENQENAGSADINERRKSEGNGSKNIDALSKHSLKPQALDLRRSSPEANLPSEFSSDTSNPGSATSDYFSNMPSPELKDASKAEYFGVASPIEVITPSFVNQFSQKPEDTISRQSSQRTERGERLFLDGRTSPNMTLSRQRSRASTVIIDGTIDEDTSAIEEPQLDYHTVLSDIEARNTSAESHFAKKSQSTAPSRISDEIPFTDHSQQIDGDPDQTINEPSSLSASVALKSGHRFEDFADLSPGYTPVKLIHKKSTSADEITMGNPSSTTGVAHGKNTNEQFEERISSILTQIPADIRLASGPDLNATEVARSSVTSGLKKLARRPPPPRLSRAQTSAPSSPAITLAPVTQSTPHTPNSDSKIKLYHLHQPGKETPIRLFVRLVGDNGERVMVRIGGGWADLGEYLKEYASHHGRRAVSDSRFNIQNLPQSQSSSPVPTLASFSNTRPTPKSQPGSPTAEFSSTEAPSRPRRSSMISSGASMNPKTPDVRPGSRDSNMSRYSWVSEDSPSPSPSLSLGLAGPRTKQMNVSPNKQAWVDTMLERARRSGGEKTKKNNSSHDEPFGELGIVGGTKRLFVKRNLDK